MRTKAWLELGVLSALSFKIDDILWLGDCLMWGFNLLGRFVGGECGIVQFQKSRNQLKKLLKKLPDVPKTPKFKSWLLGDTCFLKLSCYDFTV